MGEVIRRGWLYEAVVVSGRGHAAPMGVKFSGADTIELEVYKTAETCRNIRGDGGFTVYFTDAATFGGVLEKKRLEGKRSYASLTVEVASTENLGNKIRFKGKITSKSRMEKITLINRAEALYLEALIESTKPKPDSAKIKECLRVVSKVAPNSEYHKRVRKILEKERPKLN
jgi:hypothetical protein